MTEVGLYESEVRSEATEIQALAKAAPTGSLSVAVFELMRNAEVLIRSGESRLALNLLRVASNKDPRNVLVMKRLVTALEACGKYEEALVIWKNLMRYDYSFESSYGHAQCLYKLERDDLAIQAYYDCMSIVTSEKPELFEVYKNVGNILVKQGDFEAAEEYFNKAFNMNKKSDVLLVNIATLEYQRQDMEKSLFGFRQAIEQNPKNDKAWVGLALLHHKMGDVDLSLANLEKAIDLNGSNRTALLLFAAWAESQEYKCKAAEAIQSYLAATESDSEMSLVLIQLLCQTHQEKNAEIELYRSYIMDPGNERLSHLYLETQGFHAS